MPAGFVPLPPAPPPAEFARVAAQTEQVVTRFLAARGACAAHRADESSARAGLRGLDGDERRERRRRLPWTASSVLGLAEAAVGGVVSGGDGGNRHEGLGDMGVGQALVVVKRNTGRDYTDEFDDGALPPMTVFSGSWSETGGEARCTAVDLGSNLRAALLYSGFSGYTACDVVATIGGTILTGTYAVLARMSGALGAESGYAASLTATGRAELWRIDSDVFTSLNCVTGLSVAVGAQLRLQALGSALAVWVNGVPVVTSIDSTHTTGSVGLGVLSGTANQRFARFDVVDNS